MHAPVMTDSGKRVLAWPRAAGASGFTLTELMITLGVLGILVAAALPALGNLVRGQRVKSATSDIYASLVFARSEAIKRAVDVDLVPTAADWATGWRVRVQATNVNLKVQDAIGGVAVALAPAGTLTYGRDGRLSGTVANFTVSVSGDNSITARCIRLDPSGRPNIKVDTNGNPADGCN